MKFIIHSKKYGDKEVLIDDEDWKKVKKYKWYVHKEYLSQDVFYVVSKKRNRKSLFLHRLIMRPPKNKMVDHKDRNGLNNKKSNLRICTRSENCSNRKNQKNNTSGFKGVHYQKEQKKYVAYIRINKIKIHLGYFEIKEDAHKAYCKASKKYHGKFGRIE